MLLETDRLMLWPAEAWMLDSLINKDSKLARGMGVQLEPDFTMFGNEPLIYAMEKMQDPEEKQWWTYLPILKSNNTLIGTCGYKGKPDSAGGVEIGYELSAKYRGIGLAKEMAGALINNAFHFEQIKFIMAHTLAEMNESCSILKANGFEFAKALYDPEDGHIWQWKLEKK